MPNPSRLRIGVFIPNGAQLLDVTPIDLFGMLSPTYLEVTPLPAPLKALGIPITIHYIGLATPTSKYAELTASAFLLLTNTIADKEVQPGQLDVLLIPGPEPSSTFASEALEFIRGHAGKEGTDVLSICTGCLLLAASGVLKGKQASGPRGLVSDLRKKYPDTKWDESRRWVQDGNIWSSGGVTNGQELVAGYMRNKFPGPLTDTMLAMADVGEKGVEYGTSARVDTMWWVWQILRAAVVGLGAKKRKEV